MDNKEYIGIDLGEARTGFARGSSIAKMAEPLFTIPTNEALNKLLSMISEKNIDAVVIGRPRNLQGDETAQSAWVRKWVDGVKPKINVPVYSQDEALTSKLAEASKLADGSLHDIDSLAAAIILQDFINSEEAERVIW